MGNKGIGLPKISKKLFSVVRLEKQQRNFASVGRSVQLSGTKAAVKQGVQIGRIFSFWANFAFWASVYFGHLSKIYK
jgi:hypothetical protein